MLVKGATANMFQCTVSLELSLTPDDLIKNQCHHSSVILPDCGDRDMVHAKMTQL